MDWVALLLIAILWLVHSSRMKRLREDIAKLSEERDAQQRMIQQLTQRVFHLERGERPVEAHRAPEAAPEPASAAEPVIETPVPLVAEPEPLYIPPLPPEPVASHRPADRNWESVIGGSWLNALGVLIVVLGVARFLAYAFEKFGPVGKVSIGVGVSLVMLAAGIFIERREKYVVLGRGLLAGGWAVLYLTVYAAHALDAARIIESPLLAGVALMVIACGMIGHSMRYRSQNLTLLAFFSAYLALQIGPQSALSIAASIPLTVSLLTISRELNWNLVPLAGMVLTYFTFAFRYHPEELKPTYGSAALYAYWLCFELYDLLKLRAAAQRGLIELTIFPLNAGMFIGTAFLTLPTSTPVQSAYFLATAGCLFLLSTALRMRWKAVLDGTTSPVEDLLQAGHRMALVISSALFAGAILRRFGTERSIIGLLMEAQLLVLAGLRFDRFFCHTGAAVFGVAIASIAFRSEDFAQMSIRGWTFGGWVPFLLWMGTQFYFNRWLTRGGPHYTWAAAALLAIATGELLGVPWCGTVWAAMGFLLLEVYLRTRSREFHYQAIGLSAIGAVALTGAMFDAGAHEARRYALASACGAVLLYATAWNGHRRAAAGLLRDGLVALATVVSAVAMWKALPTPWVALGWGSLAVPLLETGMAAGLPWIRWQGHALAFCAFARIVVANLPALSDTTGIAQRLLTVTPLIAIAWHCWLRTRSEQHRVDRIAWHGYSCAGVILAVALLHFELPRMLVAIGWAALMLALVSVGIRRDLHDLRLQSYVLAVFTFVRAWATNFSSTETMLGLPAGVITGVLVIAAFHAAQFLTPREEPATRPAFALMGGALLAILLYYKISGGILTIAWGIQAVATLIAGFIARERMFRFMGLALFGVCILKLFAYDSRNFESLTRTVSYIVLGLLLIGASGLYMRFRDKIQRYL